MTITQSIPLGQIPGRIEQVGLTPQCMVDTLNTLVQRWAATDVRIHYEMTCNYINEEMELTEDEAGMFLVYTVDELVRVGAEIRQANLTGRLLAFTVSNYVILLTFAEEVTQVTGLMVEYNGKLYPLGEEPYAQRTKLSIVVSGLKLVGGRDDLQYLELLKPDTEVTLPGEYLKDVWVETPGRYPDDGPARVYPESLADLTALMAFSAELGGSEFFQVGATAKGLEMLLAYVPTPVVPVQEVAEPDPLPWPDLVVGRTGGIIVYGRAVDFHLLGISILPDRQVEDLFSDYHLEVKTAGHTPILFWVRDADLLAMLAQAISVVVKKSTVVIMEGKEPRNVFHDGAHVPPPGGA